MLQMVKECIHYKRCRFCLETYSCQKNVSTPLYANESATLFIPLFYIEKETNNYSHMSFISANACKQTSKVPFAIQRIALICCAGSIISAA